MEEPGRVKTPEPATLMQALNLLQERCDKLSAVSEFAERMESKLHRTEDSVMCEEKVMSKEITKQDVGNIVELFNSVSYRLETQIEKIGKSIISSINIIE